MRFFDNRTWIISLLFCKRVQKPRYSLSFILNSCIIWTILGSSSYSNSVLCPPQYFNPIYLSLAIHAQSTEELSLSTKLTLSIYESELVGLIFTLSKKSYNCKTARCCCSHAIARAHPGANNPPCASGNLNIKIACPTVVCFLAPSPPFRPPPSSRGRRRLYSPWRHVTRR